MDYKHLRHIKVVAGFVLFGLIFFYAFQVESKTKIEKQGVYFSRESGFYDEPFYLSMECDEGEIYYTLDSSDPDENSILYTGPIYIQDASQNPNVYSIRKDVTADFLKKTETGKSYYYRYDVPKKPIDKATIIKAICIDGNKEKSDIKCATYFVGFDQKKGYNGMNIISITTDPKNLFDYESGIYVLGQKLEEYSNRKNLSADMFRIFTWKGNYHQKGMNWEREAIVSFWDPDRNLTFSGNLGIRIQGGLGRALIPKSLNLFARKEYGTSQISGDVINDNYDYISLNLNSGSNCMSTKLNDFLVSQTNGVYKSDIRTYTFYVLFLDGEYWGVYWLTSKYESQYFENNYRIKGDNIILVKDDEIEIGNDEDYNLFINMVEYITENDISSPDIYRTVQDMIDIESCIDYYAIEIYIANTDWPNHNYSCWRSRKTDKTPYSDCKWRWVLFDLNKTMLEENAEADMIKRTEEIDKLFYGLMQNQEFRQALYAKLVELANGSFNPCWTDEFIEEYKIKMTDIMQKEYERFYGDDKPISDFLTDCDSIKSFFQRRYQYIIDTYGSNE